MTTSSTTTERPVVLRQQRRRRWRSSADRNHSEQADARRERLRGDLTEQPRPHTKGSQPDRTYLRARPIWRFFRYVSITPARLPLSAERRIAVIRRCTFSASWLLTAGCRSLPIASRCQHAAMMLMRESHRIRAGATAIALLAGLKWCRREIGGRHGAAPRRLCCRRLPPHRQSQKGRRGRDHAERAIGVAHGRRWISSVSMLCTGLLWRGRTPTATRRSRSSDRAYGSPASPSTPPPRALRRAPGWS